MNDEPVLSVRDLWISYRTGKRTEVTAAVDVSFDLYPGESMALVGESGCGKTTLGLGLLKLLPRLGRVPRGTVTFRRKDGGECDIMRLGPQELRRFRWNEAAMVFQGAMNAFNPVQRIEDHFRETLLDHQPTQTSSRARGSRGPGESAPDEHAGTRRLSAAEIAERSAELLDMVRLEPKRVLRSYPHELSGGMKQRALIALALALRPRLLILDEPTTALDLLTQRSIVEQLHELRERLGFSMIFITHDLGLAAELADRVSTMYAGRIIESGTAEDIFYEPRHPYTAGLIKAVLPVAGDLPELESIPGSPPSLASLPDGCAFAPRCAHATAKCEADVPALTRVEGASGTVPHTAACHHSEAIEFSRQVVSHV